MLTSNKIGMFITDDLECLHGGSKEHDQYVVGYVLEEDKCEPIAFCHGQIQATLVLDALAKYMEIPE